MSSSALQSNSLRPPHTRQSQTPNSIKGEEPPRLIVDSVQAAAATPKFFCSNSPPNSSINTLHELIQVYSPSPTRRARGRLLDRLDMAEDIGLQSHSRKRPSKGKSAQTGCASPRNSSRRVRRRSDRGELLESREERELVGVLIEEIGRMHRRKRKIKKEKIVFAPSISPESAVENDDYGINLDAIGEAVYDLIMWNDVAKTSLWFGLGCLIFFSSYFTKGISYSLFSGLSQLGILCLGASFISNTFSQRNHVHRPRNLKLEDEDILKAVRWILPAANLAISKIREIFSGEPSMTLKMLPFLLVGAEYGHVLTTWRVVMSVFLVSFTLPRLYSSYAIPITQRVESAKQRAMEAWGLCSHKKIVAFSTLMAFWNISSLKTRIFAAFFSLVIFRCCRAHPIPTEYVTDLVETEQLLPRKADKSNATDAEQPQRKESPSPVVPEPETSQNEA